MRSIITILLFVTGSFLVTAQNADGLKKLEEKVEFDGILAEKFWSEYEVEATQSIPVFMGELIGEAKFYLSYDDEYIWLAGELNYSEDAEMRAISRSRDSFDGSNDYFGLSIDSYNDNENALSFFTTPAGIRWDAAVSNDAQGDLPINVSWNTFWNVKSQRDENTWTVEMRIPFTSLRFQDENGEVTMGFSIFWYYSAIQQVAIFPSIERKYGNWSSFKASLFKKFKLSGVYAKKPIYISPYLSGAWSSQVSLNQTHSDYTIDENLSQAAGLDAKFSLGQGWTADLTFNTDFAQVEADVQQANISRFSLFFPEKRLFFQERASLFRFTSGDNNRMFHSRRIGIDSENQMVPILGGVRLTGRSGKMDFGIINMQSKEIQSQPGTNYSVIRFKKQIGGSNSSIGLMGTNVIDSYKNHSTTIGSDALLNLRKNRYLSINYAMVGDSLNQVKINSGKFFVNLVKRELKGFTYDLMYANIGHNYNPAMGFEMRNNVNQFSNIMGYGWISKEKSLLMNHQWYFGNHIYKNIQSGMNETIITGSAWVFTTKKGASGELKYSVTNENIENEFEILGTVFQPGNYSYGGLDVTLNSASSGKLNYIVWTYLGTFYDARHQAFGLIPSWKPSELFMLGADYSQMRLDFDDNAKDLTAHFLGIKSELSFSAQLNLSVFFQYNTINQKVFSNIRLRYNPREGNDLFLVFNDLENTLLPTEISGFPRYENRTIMLKYMHTFVVK